MLILDHTHIDKIKKFSLKWKVTRFSLFGSAINHYFTNESDVDVLLSFAPDQSLNLFDYVDMRDELVAIFNRPVDLVNQKVLESSNNQTKKDEIINNSKVIYAA
jgi:predicted nucleotidyltransferase